MISVEIDGDTSMVSPKYCRNLPFEKFWFKINDEGLPEYCEPNLKPKNEDKLKGLFNELLPPTVTLAYADLRSKVMRNCDIKDKTAEKKIKQAFEQGIILKNEVGFYYIPIEETEQESLPF